MRAAMRMRRAVGFTLIELLVVVAIIGILTAILFPVFAKARSKARQTQCISNARQITMAFLMYAQDHDERLPPVTGLWAGSKYWGEASWLAFLQPYIKNKGLYICLESDQHGTDWTTSTDILQNYAFTPSFGTRGPFYGSNVTTFAGTALMEGLGGFYTAGGWAGSYQREEDSKMLGEIARPTENIIVMDHWAWDWGFGWNALWYPAARHMPDGDPAFQESGFVDCGFVDGHVKAMRHRTTWKIEKDKPTPWGLRDVYFYHWPYT